MDNKSEIAYFSHDKVSETRQGRDLDDMHIIVRELQEGPPSCECDECKARRHAKGKWRQVVIDVNRSTLRTTALHVRRLQEEGPRRAR